MSKSIVYARMIGANGSAAPRTGPAHQQQQQQQVHEHQQRTLRA
jgi:hypothetical protein